MTFGVFLKQTHNIWLSSEPKMLLFAVLSNPLKITKDIYCPSHLTHDKCCPSEISPGIKHTLTHAIDSPDTRIYSWHSRFSDYIHNNASTHGIWRTMAFVRNSNTFMWFSALLISHVIFGDHSNLPMILKGRTWANSYKIIRMK